MQQLWSYLWFRFTEMTALGKSAFKIFLNSEKELLRKSRVWFFWLVGWAFGGFCAFVSFRYQSPFAWGMSQGQCFFCPFCFGQALGHPLWKGVWGGCCYLPALALVSGKLPRWASFLNAQLPRAFQILKILSIHCGKELGRSRGEGDNLTLCQESLMVGQPGARRDPGAGEKRQVIPVLFFSWNLLGCKCQVPNPPLPPCTLTPALAASLRSTLVVRRSWRDQSNETQKPRAPRRDKTTPQSQTSWEGGFWMSVVLFHLCTGHTRQHMA